MPRDIDTSNQIAQPLNYRDCVGVVIFDQEGKVFAGRRVIRNKTKYEEGLNLWQLPQGGIDPEEDPLNAAYREVYEETGIKSLRFLAEIDEWLYYDLPPELLGVALQGAYRGQKQKWFAFLFLGTLDEIQVNPPPDNHPVEFDQWKFLDLKELAQDVVPFKRKIYERLVQEFSAFSAERLSQLS